MSKREPGNDQIEVTGNPQRSCYEVRVNGDLAGVCEYKLKDDVMAFTHTEIDPAFEGRGVGSALVRQVLDDVRAKGDCRVLPVCPFVKRWIERHPDYQDLLHT